MYSYEGYVNDVRIVEKMKVLFESFHNDIRAYSASMRNGASGLGNEWKDSQYQQFLSCIDSLASQLDSDASCLDQAVYDIRKELSEV